MYHKVILSFALLTTLNCLFAKSIESAPIESNILNQEPGVKINIQYSSITTDYKTMDQMGGFNIIYDLVKNNSDINYLMACSSLQSAMLLAASKKDFKNLFSFNGSVQGINVNSKESDYLFQDGNKYKLKINNNALDISNKDIKETVSYPYNGFLYCSVKYQNNSINIQSIYLFQVSDYGSKNN
mgnify:FL=1